MDFLACVVIRAAARCTQVQEGDLIISQPITPTDNRPDQVQGRPLAVQDVGYQDGGDSLVIQPFYVLYS